MEGFIPVCLFTAFAIVLTKLFLDVFDSPDLFKSLVIGSFVTAVITTFLDGIYIVVPISVIVLIAVVFAHKISLKRSLFHWSILFGSAAVFNFPYLQMIWVELSGSAGMARPGLNGLYPFAYTPKVLAWAFWGSSLDTAAINGFSYSIMMFVSIFLLIVGIYAIMHILIRDHYMEGLPFYALIFLPLVFMTTKK